MQDKPGALSPTDAAARQVAGALGEVADAVYAVRALVRDTRPHDREVDRAPARKVRPGLLLRNPFFAAQWRARVPDTHLEDEGATVRCHERVTLEVGELGECPLCPRWFLRLAGSMRVAQWDPCELEDRYAGPGWTPLEAV